MGTLLNQRLTPQILATDEDIDLFCPDIYERLRHLIIFMFNLMWLIADTLYSRRLRNRKNINDLLIRVASYVSYFVEIDPVGQMDIIHRTEQNNW